MIWEYLRPARQPTQSRLQRWRINLGLGFFNAALLRITVGGIAFQGALVALENSWGLLNQFNLPYWFIAIFTFLALDFAIYLQHVVAHKWQWLWQLHRVHHTDIELDTTTAIRFHPLEIIVSMAYKVGIIYCLGADPATVIAFEIILNGCALFNHSNIAITPRIDNILRWFIVTPSMHLTHHSTIKSATDSNYGFSVSCWDRLCKTYIKQVAQITMDIGQADLRNHKQLSWIKLLKLPFGNI